MFVRMYTILKCVLQPAILIKDSSKFWLVYHIVMALTGGNFHNFYISWEVVNMNRDCDFHVWMNMLMPTSSQFEQSFALAKALQRSSNLPWNVMHFDIISWSQHGLKMVQCQFNACFTYYSYLLMIFWFLLLEKQKTNKQYDALGAYM